MVLYRHAQRPIGEDHDVVAFTASRTLPRSSICASKVAVGDLHHRAAAASAIAGTDAVIST